MFFFIKKREFLSTFFNFIVGNGIGIIPKVINIVSKINILSDRGIPKKNYKMAVTTWRQKWIFICNISAMCRKLQNLIDFDKTWYQRVIDVGDQESEVRLEKFKMADSIWRTKFLKINWIRLKIVTRGFLGSLITNMTLVCKNSKWQIQYGRQTTIWPNELQNFLMHH